MLRRQPSIVAGGQQSLKTHHQIRPQNFIRRPGIGQTRLDHVEHTDIRLLVDFEFEAERGRPVFVEPVIVEIIKEFAVGIDGLQRQDIFQRKFQLGSLPDAGIIRSLILDPAEFITIARRDVQMRADFPMRIDLQFHAMVKTKFTASGGRVKNLRIQISVIKTELYIFPEIEFELRADQIEIDILRVVIEVQLIKKDEVDLFGVDEFEGHELPVLKIVAGKTR